MRYKVWCKVDSATRKTTMFLVMDTDDMSIVAGFPVSTSHDESRQSSRAAQYCYVVNGFLDLSVNESGKAHDAMEAKFTVARTEEMKMIEAEQIVEIQKDSEERAAALLERVSRSSARDVSWRNASPWRS